MSKITFLFFGVLILAFSVSYGRDGVLDASFDEDGKLYLHFNGYSESQMGTVLVQPDDKIVAGGVNHNHDSNQQIFIPLYKGDSSPYSTFESNSLIEGGFSGAPILQMLILQANNKILIAGYFTVNSPNSHVSTFLARYNVDRAIDNGFVVKEIVNIDFELGQSEELSIDLYNTDGRKVANIMKDKDFQAGFNSQQLDFPGTVAAGIYFLKVSGENETKNFRIVKK